ncbi:reverse transcriptase domain-containing protein [Tanacetum coccineum]
MLSPLGAGKTLEGLQSLLFLLLPCLILLKKNPNKNSDDVNGKVANPNLENTAHVPSPEEEESMEIPKPKAKKTVNFDPNSPNPNSYQSKFPYPERMKVRENDKPSAQHSRFLKMFKQLRLEIGLKDALVEMSKFNKWLSSLLRNKEKLEEIAPSTIALADSGASINLLPHSIYKKLGLEALTPTRMTLELANRLITHPMGIAEDVVVRVDGFTFLVDFVVVNFEPDPRVPIILGRPFLRTAKLQLICYFDSDGDVTFLDNLLSDNASHNLSSEDSEPTQEEIDIFLVPDNLIPPGVENDDSEDEVNESPTCSTMMIV